MTPFWSQSPWGASSRRRGEGCGLWGVGGARAPSLGTRRVCPSCFLSLLHPSSLHTTTSGAPSRTHPYPCFLWGPEAGPTMPSARILRVPHPHPIPKLSGRAGLPLPTHPSTPVPCLTPRLPFPFSRAWPTSLSPKFPLLPRLCHRETKTHIARNRHPERGDTDRVQPHTRARACARARARTGGSGGGRHTEEAFICART